MPKDTDRKAPDVVRLWLLPDDFFSLSPSQQFSAISAVTSQAVPLARPRSACRMRLGDDALAVLFFLVTLGIPLLIFACVSASAILRSPPLLVGTVLASAVLAFHPIPRGWSNLRRSRLALALVRYFSMEILIDRSDPLLENLATAAVDDDEFLGSTTGDEKKSGGISLPLVCLACPHGVFNYGAIVWCCVSRWFVGREQRTASAAAVRYVPGLRYMDPLVWCVDADRASVTRALRERGRGSVSGGDDDDRSVAGGMLGVVPDGILGAFRCRGGVDELAIGPRRGLMRICGEEGATVFAAWFFGTTDMLTVVQDPLGVMERVSRWLRAGFMGVYGRWGLPVPRRIPVTVCIAPYRCRGGVGVKTMQCDAGQVQRVHEGVYGGLQRVYDEQKVYAGYPDRTLIIS